MVALFILVTLFTANPAYCMRFVFNKESNSCRSDQFYHWRKAFSLSGSQCLLWRIRCGPKLNRFNCIYSAMRTSRRNRLNIYYTCDFELVFYAEKALV